MRYDELGIEVLPSQRRRQRRRHWRRISAISAEIAQASQVHIVGQQQVGDPQAFLQSTWHRVTTVLPQPTTIHTPSKKDPTIHTYSNEILGRVAGLPSRNPSFHAVRTKIIKTLAEDPMCRLLSFDPMSCLGKQDMIKLTDVFMVGVNDVMNIGSQRAAIEGAKVCQQHVEEAIQRCCEEEPVAALRRWKLFAGLLFLANIIQCFLLIVCLVVIGRGCSFL